MPKPAQTSTAKKVESKTAEKKTAEKKPSDGKQQTKTPQAATKAQPPAKAQPQATEKVQQDNKKPTNANPGEEEELPKIHCTEFKMKRTYFKPHEVKADATQLMCFPKYMYDEKQQLTRENFEKYANSLIVVTDSIKMFKGGIARYNAKYHDGDKDSMKRAYFYIPRDDKDPASRDLFKMVGEFDDYMHEEINVKKNENKVLCALMVPRGSTDGKAVRAKLTGITYTRMITTAKPGDGLGTEFEIEGEEGGKPKKDDKNSNKKEFVPWDRIKVRFATKYDEKAGVNDKKPITTQIFVGDKDEPEDCTTVSQFEKHFMWGCKAQYALMFNKIWIKRQDDKKCGVGIKCLQIGVTEQPEFKKSTSVTKQISGKLFAKTALTRKPASTDNGETSPTKTLTKSTTATTNSKGNVKAPPKQVEPVEVENEENPDNVDENGEVENTENADVDEAPAAENEENADVAEENTEGAEDNTNVAEENPDENAEENAEAPAEEIPEENGEENGEEPAEPAEEVPDEPEEEVVVAKPAAKGKPTQNDLKVKSKVPAKPTATGGAKKTGK